jgi:hypothetical protein
MKIAQVSNLSGRAQNLLAKMIGLAPILQVAEFKLDPSTFLHFKDSDTFTSTAARQENAVAQKDNQVPTGTAMSLALYTRETAIDDVRKLDANVGYAPAALKLMADRRLGGLAVKLAQEVQDHMLTGTNASYQMLGISTFVKDAASGGQTTALGFTTAEQAAMNTNVSLQLNDTDNQNEFAEFLEKNIALVPAANAILVNTNLAARLTTIAKRLGAAGETVNSFGVPVKTFNGVPIVPLPTTAIPQTESDGSNSDCTSLYIVRFAEELGTAFSTNSGFYFQDFENAETYPQGKARMQMFLQLAVERTDALKRLSRIRL